MIKRNKKGQFLKGSTPIAGFKKGIIPWSKSQKGVHLSPKSEFKKGMIPWNKVLTIVDKRVAQYVLHGAISRKGQHFSPKTEFKKGQKTWNKGKPHLIDEKHPQWKGNRVGYSALHTWIHRTWGKNKKCDFCGLEKKLDWANKNGIYNRNRINWLNLCKRCHIIYDKKSPKKSAS